MLGTVGGNVRYSIAYCRVSWHVPVIWPEGWCRSCLACATRYVASRRCSNKIATSCGQKAPTTGCQSSASCMSHRTRRNTMCGQKKKGVGRKTRFIWLLFPIWALVNEVKKRVIKSKLDTPRISNNQWTICTQASLLSEVGNLHVNAGRRIPHAFACRQIGVHVLLGPRLDDFHPLHPIATQKEKKKMRNTRTSSLVKLFVWNWATRK